MGVLELETKYKKMKLTAVLAATASANVTNFIVENWWEAAVNTFNYAQGNWGSFAAAADSIPDSQWKPLWNFCNADGSAEISADELTTCAAAAAQYVGMSEASQGFLYNFGVTDAQVILKGFDSNTDGILSGSELSSFRSFVEGALASNDWNPSASDVAAIKAAWANAQVDGDDNTASLLELAKFTVGAWNVLLA